MSDRLERTLDVIDGGLQRSSEASYGDDNGLCARCQTTEPLEGGELCGGCRAFLLGDSENDPSAERETGGGWVTFRVDANGGIGTRVVMGPSGAVWEFSVTLTIV